MGADLSRNNLNQSQTDDSRTNTISQLNLTPLRKRIKKHLTFRFLHEFWLTVISIDRNEFIMLSVVVMSDAEHESTFDIVIPILIEYKIAKRVEDRGVIVDFDILHNMRVTADNSIDTRIDECVCD